ncbi:hypothetical protein I4U23_022484 [Adineta vaga]|nr:hypothetical protein I4U23_022484 [Adineta vaga]
MSSTTFAFVTAQFSIYVGLPIFSFGIIGNLINICILYPTRSTSCSFFLLMSSFFNLIALSTGLLPRVLTLAFNIDPSSINIFWCKSRLFFSYLGTLPSITFICFASIDRYLMTCRNAAWRNRSTLKTAKIAVIITILITIGINVPYLIYFTIIEKTTTQCIFTSPGFILYANYFLRPVLFSIIPGTILVVTGLLTYRNIKSITAVQLRDTFQRNLTSMILLQIFAILIPVIPFATINIYQTLSSSIVKTSFRIAQETLAADIGTIILYASYGSNFYIYLISASSYRQDFRRLVLFCCNRNQRNNRIATVTREQVEMNTILCPCTEYSISYNTFLSSKPSYHQVCSSSFVSDSWIAQFYFGHQQGSFSNDDFRIFFPINQYMLIEIDTISLKQEDESYCNCTVSPSCESAYVEILALNNSQFNVSFPIPGLKLRCMPVETCLYSTLECFFNQTCINRILSYMSITPNYSVMISTESNRFHPKTKIETIARELMIENWNFNITYENYYEKCAPKSCTYFAPVHQTISYIAIELIGLLSGLCLVLRIVMLGMIRIVQYLYSRRNRTREIVVQPAPTRSEKSRVIVKLVFKILKEFNLFEKSNENVEEHQIYHQRIITRTYILLMIATLGILLFYTSLTERILTKTVNHPSESIYTQIESLYSSSLHCQCSQMSIDYNKFLHIRPIFHQVCSSDLVSTGWIDLLRENYRPPPFEVSDMFYMGTGLFQLLKIFCETVNTTISSSLERFLRRQIVRTEVLSKDLLNIQLTTLIEQWRNGTTYDVLQTINLFRANMQGNMLLSDSYNFQWHSTIFNDVYLYFNFYLPDPYTFDSCTCALSAYCGETLLLLDSNVRLLNIDGFVIACSPVTSLMQSNLEIFYNKSFIDELFTYVVYNSKNFSLNPLDIWNTSQINETLQTISDRSFVDQWISEISFTKYYETCAPSSCTYQIVQRPDFLFILITIIALIGGLATLFKILLTIILLALKKFQRQFPRGIIKTWFIGFTDQRRLSTRLNVILIIMSVIGLYFSYAFRKYQQVIEIAKEPTFEIYFDLIHRYPNESLHCPCSQASISYNSFINLSVTHYHQICSKEFLTYEWLNEYIPKRTPVVGDPSTFSDVIPGYFQLINEFCQSAQKTVHTKLIDFLATSLVETSPNPSVNNFQNLIQDKIEQFKIELPLSILRILDLLREITHVNQLATISRNNWKFLQINQTSQINDSQGITAMMVPVRYDNCDCGLSKYCTKSMIDWNDDIILGLMTGCYPLEALLQSSLECFYNETCFLIMTEINSYYIDASSTILNISTASRFRSDMKFEEILKNLFIEQWSMNISYERYYKVCAPSFCSYSYLESVPISEIIKNLLGLYGGLTIIIQTIVVPLLIQLTIFIKRPFRRVENINQ